MPLSKNTIKKARQFLRVIEIGNKIILNSDILDEKTIKAFGDQDQWLVKTVESSLAENDLNAAGLKSLIDSYLVFWNESAGTHVEVFWATLHEEGIDYVRKDILQNVLEKGRFRNVHQAMSARKNWGLLKESHLFISRLGAAKIRHLNAIISEDETSRVQLLRKCLQLKRISPSSYLKFGDCMGYMDYCALFPLHFSKKEVDDLYILWDACKI